MKKILITGAAGFVASYFIEYLKQKDLKYNILGLDIIDKFSIDYENFQYKKINLRDKDLIKEVIENYNPDYIIHLAAISSVSKSWQYPVESFVNNTNIFLNIIESIRELGLTTRILSIGSSEEYGNYPSDKMPLKEDYELKPCNPYSIARVSQEMLSRLYADAYHLNIIMTRSFNHIGPRQKDTFVIPSFIKQLIKIKHSELEEMQVGNIEIVRDFLDVRDVVDAYYKILTEGKIGETYNVCSGIGKSLKDIIREASQYLGITPKIIINKDLIRPTDNMIIIGDNAKLKNELQWNPNHTLENTLKDMIEYQEQIYEREN